MSVTRRQRRQCRRSRSSHSPFLAALFALVLASLLHVLHGLDLSSQGLTKIVASDSNTTAAADTTPTSFTPFRGDERLSPIAATDLALATELVLRDNALSSVPASFFRALQNAQRVDLSNNPKLVTLESNSFVDLPQLVEITCVNTSLLELPALLVRNCPQLESVTFNRSFIHTIHPNAITNAPSLQTIHISINNVTQLFWNSFVNLSALHTLDLSANNLTTVPGELFRVSRAWRALDFTRNNLTRVPSMIQDAVVPGYISLERNLLFEIYEGDFANAASIAELRLAHNGIFTINSKPFTGMRALRKLDLSDNVISVIRPDAFDGLEALTELLLSDNYLKRLKLEAIPPQLERLELQSNLLDLMPDLSDKTQVLKASNLRVLNLSHNVIWGLETNTQLKPFVGLVELDVSWNRIEIFTANVLTFIKNTIVSINMDHNQIAAVPSTVFLEMLNSSRTAVSLQANPGIGLTPVAPSQQRCPNGSVYNHASVRSPVQLNNDAHLFGCIQCGIGSFHDVTTNECVMCVDRAFADQDGATACQYCPYSSDLDKNKQQCLPFACNEFCWMTVVLGFGIPLAVFLGKLLLYTISTTIAKQQQLNLVEQEQMTTWRMEQMMRQLGATSTTLPPPTAGGGQDADDDATTHGNGNGGGGATPGATANGGAQYYHHSNATLGPCRIYDLPRETQETVLETLQEHFSLRKHKLQSARRGATGAATAVDTATASNSDAPLERTDLQLDTTDWDNVEWSTFHMHRILSRNYHGEVFLGDYCGAHVVVKRLMTLRFEVRELADAINDVELMLSLRHPQITTCLGTMWTAKEHLCVVSEFVKGGDLHSVLELESMHHTTGNMMRSHYGMSGGTDAFHPQLFVGGGSNSNDHFDSSAGAAATGDGSDLPALTWYATKLQMMRDVGRALAFAHDASVSHSDLRSRNVLVTESFGCKLNDFAHNARSTKYANMTLRLQTDASDDESSSSDDDDDGGGGHGLDDAGGDSADNAALTRRQDAVAPPRHLMLPLLPPEVLHHAPKHLGSDIYSCGVLLIELWFYRHVSITSVSPMSVHDDTALLGVDAMLLEQHRKLSTTAGAAGGNAAETNELNGLLQPLVATDTSNNHNAYSPELVTSVGSLDRAKLHSAMVQTFMTKLRTCAHWGPDETTDRSFGTTTTASSSSASLLSFASTAMMTEKVLTAIEECLHYDPKKRPSAKMLVKLFQQLLDESSLR